MAKITYPEKVSNNGQTIQGKFFSADANEIKTSVNDLYDEVEDISDRLDDEVIARETADNILQENIDLKAKKFIKSNESLAGASRKDDVLYGIVDQYTGEEITLSKVTGTPTVDNIIYFQEGSEFFKRNYSNLNALWFGVKGDGIIDDTLLLRIAANLASNLGEVLFIPDGDYLINVDDVSSGGLILQSNTHIICSSNTYFIQKPTAKVASSLFAIRNVSNIKILGGNFIGDRDSVVTPAPDNHGIFIGENADNITIVNTNISNFRGDGIVLAAFSLTDDASSNILIDNVDCNNNGRQGLSIISGKNVRVLNSRFRNTNGSAPQAGVDIEPNAGNFCRDIIIDNCYFEGNYGQGLVITGNDDTSRVENVFVTNCTCINNKSDGILVGGRPLIKNIIIQNIKIVQDNTCTGFGLYMAESTDVNISNVNIAKDGTGAAHIVIVRATNLLLKNIYSRSSSLGIDLGISLTFTNSNISIVGCDIISKGDAINFLDQVSETRTNINISNNVLFSSLSRGILLNDVTGLIISNNEINGAALDGINLFDCYNVKILANSITNAGSSRASIDRGIFLNSVSDAFVSNNYVRGGGADVVNKLKCALELSALSKRIIVSGNNFTDTWSGGIAIVNLSNYKNYIDDDSILKTGVTLQRPSLTDNTIPVGFSYYDQTLSALLICKGAYETASVAINTAATSSGNITITLNGVPYIIPVTAGDSRDLISQRIADFGYDGWSTNRFALSVMFTKDVAGVASDTTVSTGATGVSAPVTLRAKGFARFYELAVNTIIDATSNSYTKSTLNAAYPLATIGTIVVQDANFQTYIKKDNLPTGNWSTFPTVQLT